MRSALGGGRGVGPQKAEEKEQNQLICDSYLGGGVKKSEHFADVIYGRPLCLLPPLPLSSSVDAER